MKKAFLLVMILGFWAFGATAQEKENDRHEETEERPFQKAGKLPAFNIMQMDSSTIFNTYNIPEGRKVIIMLFSPECKHCKAEMEELLGGMDRLEDVDFYLVTPFHDMSAIKRFYKEHHLSDFKNIKLVGRDYEFFYHDYYKVKVIPDLALYDEHKKLVKLFEGETSVKELTRYTRER